MVLFNVDILIFQKSCKVEGFKLMKKSYSCPSLKLLQSLFFFAFLVGFGTAFADGIQASDTIAVSATGTTAIASKTPVLEPNSGAAFLKNMQRFSSIWIKFTGVHAFRFNLKDTYVTHYQQDMTVPAYTAREKEKLTWIENSFSADQPEPVGDQQHTYSISGTIDPDRKTVSVKCSAKATTTLENWTFTIKDLPYQSGEKNVISFYATGDVLKKIITINEAGVHNPKCRLGTYVETDWTGQIADAVSISRKQIPTLIVTFTRD